MAVELDTGLPSIRYVQAIIKDTREVELKLSTGDLIAGKIQWQDSQCICIEDHYNQATVVWRQAIVFLKQKS